MFGSVRCGLAPSSTTVGTAKKFAARLTLPARSASAQPRITLTSSRVGLPRRGVSLPSICRTIRSSVPGVVRLKRSESLVPHAPRPSAIGGTIQTRWRMPR